MTNTGNWKLGLLLSLITALMWGFLPFSIAPLLTTLDPYTITFYRLGGGGFLLFVWLVSHKHRPAPRNLSPVVYILLIIAILCICGNYLYWLKGLDLTTPATSQVVIQIAPMLLLLGSVVIYKEDFSFKQGIGVAIFVAGLLLFFNQRLGDLLAEVSDYNLGIFYIVFASIIWAIYALVQKRLLQNFQPLELIFIIVSVGSLLFLPYATPSDITKLDTLQLWMLGFGTVNTAVAYGCFTEAMRHWDTSRVSAVVAIVPVLTLIIGYLLYTVFPDFLQAESINNLSIMGAIVVVVGSAITALSKASTKTDQAYIDYD